jgi:FimV-like protein
MEKVLKKKADFEDIEKAIGNKEFMSAIALCDERVVQNPRNMLEYLRLKSNLCLTIGRYEEANEVFEMVMGMRDIPWARIGLGKVHFFMGAYLKAKEIFQTIIEENRTFMEAYDWMAKTLHELGSLEEAQKILLRATEISPKAIVRHQTLGKVSHEMNDYDAAENAFKSAIAIGKHSCFKSPTEYSGLAKTLMKKDASDEAIAVLGEARNEFKGNSDATFQTAVTEGLIYKEMNREEEAKKAVDEANRLLKGLSGKIPIEATMDLAKTCFDMGDKEQGKKLMQDIVRNNHDNEKVINMVQDVFNDATMQDEGEEIISSTRSEIIKLNNQGVRLVEDDKLKEAIEYFKKAASGLPENKIINANAAYALLMFLEKKGSNDQYMFQALQYLDRVKKIDPSDEKYQQLLNMYEKIASAKITQGA